MRLIRIPWIIIIILFLLFPTGLLIGGCVQTGQTVSVFQQNKDILRLSVIGGVLLVLDKHRDLVPAIHEVAAEIAGDTTSYKLTTLQVALTSVRELIKARPSYQERTPALRLVIMEMITLIESRIEGFLIQKGITAPMEIQVLIQEVAGWVRDASSVYLE